MGAIVCTIAIVSARTSTTGREVGSEPGISSGVLEDHIKEFVQSDTSAGEDAAMGSTGQSVTREFARAKAQSSRAGEGIKVSFTPACFFHSALAGHAVKLIMMSADQQPSKRTIRPLTLVMRLLHKYISYVLPLQMNHQ